MRRCSSNRPQTRHTQTHTTHTTQTDTQTHRHADTTHRHRHRRTYRHTGIHHSIVRRCFNSRDQPYSLSLSYTHRPKQIHTDRRRPMQAHRHRHKHTHVHRHTNVHTHIYTHAHTFTMQPCALLQQPTRHTQTHTDQIYTDTHRQTPQHTHTRTFNPSTMRHCSSN